MKFFALVLALPLSFYAFAQEKITPSDAFTVEGTVTQATRYTSRSADTLAVADLGEITTVNHHGEVRSTRKAVKGVLLRDYLKNLLPEREKPKEMGAYYFILVGTDGYRFVLSFNEVFSGNTIYVITESDGRGWTSIPDRVALVSLMQPHRGHIAMKGLDRIIVQKAVGK